MQPTRPIPSPNPGTAPYWRAAREHRLVLPRCLDCGKLHAYPRTLCPFCASSRLEWAGCSGHGTVYSYTEVFRAPSPAFAPDVPYVIAIVALDEGPHLMTRIVTTDNTSVRIGQRASIAFEDLDDEIALPFFRIETS
jgi:uncharacterized OB-fold protein